MLPVGANATLHGPSPQEDVLLCSLPRVPAQTFVKYLVDGKWKRKEQGGLGHILTLNKLAAHNTRTACARLAGYVLINHPALLLRRPLTDLLRTYGLALFSRPKDRANSCSLERRLFGPQVYPSLHACSGHQPGCCPGFSLLCLQDQSS